LDTVLRLDRFDYTASKPLPFLRDRPGFLTEWFACERDPTREVDTLYGYLLPDLTNWVTMLTDPSSHRNIEFFTLLAYIPAADSINLLNEWTAAHLEELHTQLFECYLTIVRNPPFKRWTCRPGQMFYLISQLMRWTLAGKIYDWARRTKRDSMLDFHSSMDSFSTPEVDNADDLFELRYQISKLPDYQHYLVSLYLLDYDRNDFERLTLTKSSFVYFWRGINEFLKAESIGNT